MSEFKFACPVCGQHMMCDSSQVGSVMECPTCFQKVAAPQVPTADAKFILTGTKVSEKKISGRGMDAAGGTVVPKNGLRPAIVIGAAVLLLAAGAAVFALRGKLFHVKSPPPRSDGSTHNPQSPPVVPHANDANWRLTLDEAVISNAPVVGRIHGQDCLIAQAIFQGGILILRADTQGPMEFGCVINFRGARPEALSGQSIDVRTNAEKAARVVLRWKDGGGAQKQIFDAGYALRLEFGALAKARLPGKIYLCAPDAEKSYLMGRFNAVVVKPKPPPPGK